MSATEAPGCETRNDAGDAMTPREIIVEFGAGPRPSLRACELDLSSWGGLEEAPGIATIALLHPAGMALHIGQSADDLRSLSAACLRAAALIDGGGSVQ